MINQPTIKVSKTEAAKSQIETAIRLWLDSGDPVSIHTLTAAAHQLVHDLGKKRGGATDILRSLPGIQDDKKKELRRLIGDYENFFKHADTDPEAFLDFKPDATEIFMLDAVIAYQFLTGETPPILMTFKAWMLYHNPQYMNEGDRQLLFEKFKITGANFSHLTKKEFFEIHLEALRRLGVK